MSKRNQIISLIYLALLFSLLILKFLNHRIVAAIIPHHLLAKELVEDLASRLQKKPPSKIVIIGPNHDEIGSDNITNDQKILTKDHACFGPKNILQSYMPETNIDCFLISTKTTASQIDQFVKSIDSTTLLIASIDFSHYLNYQQAIKNDLETKKLIENYQSNRLRFLNNDYLDSPKTLAILFEYLKKYQQPPPQIIYNLNSYQIDPQTSPESTTSYFEIIYQY